MSHSIFVRALWRARRENESACAERAVEFMTRLAPIDAALATLGWADYDRGAAFNRLEQSVSALVPLIRDGKHGASAEVRSVEDLGFSFELVNPTRSQERIRIHVDCGGYAPGFPNRVKIEFNDWSPHATQATLLACLEATMAAWDAERATVSMSAFYDLFPLVQGSLVMGSILWLPVRPRDLPPLPRSVRVEARASNSSLLVLTEERFDPDDPAHLDVARATYAAISEAGLLKVPP